MGRVVDRVRVLVVALVVGVSAGFGLGGASPADASEGFTTIYSSLGAGNAYYCCSGFAVNRDQWVGMGFTPTADAIVRQIDIALGFVTGGPNAATVQLAEDRAGAPGTVLRTWKVRELPTFGTCCTVKTITAEIAVHKGRQYWLLAETPTPTSETDATWNFSNSVFGPVAIKHGSSPWVQITCCNKQGAFDVLGRAST
jgi:hypothetical protein